MNSKYQGLFTGGSSIKSKKPDLSSKDSRLRFLQYQLEELKAVRQACNVYVPDDEEFSIKAQKSAEQRYNMFLGGVLFLVKYANGCGDIDDDAAERMSGEALATMLGTVTGSF